MTMKREWIARIVMEKINIAEAQLVELNAALSPSPENVEFMNRLGKVMDDIAALRGFVR